MEKATFGAGCFWGIEDKLGNIKGVKSTRVGYMGGKLKNPSYEEVCTGKTDHIEVVEITFNPKIVSYEKLLETFWKIHNPTTMNRQVFDIGSQYKSIIFYHTEEQKTIAEKSKKEAQKNFKNKIVTEIKKASIFCEAEEYHQKYLKKHKGVC